MKLAGFDVGLDRPFFLIAGPCVVESEPMALDTAGKLKEMTGKTPNALRKALAATVEGAVMVWPKGKGSDTSVLARSPKRRGANSSRRTRSMAESTAVSRMPRARSDRMKDAASTRSEGASG